MREVRRNQKLLEEVSVASNALSSTLISVLLHQGTRQPSPLWGPVAVPPLSACFLQPVDFGTASCGASPCIGPTLSVTDTGCFALLLLLEAVQVPSCTCTLCPGRVWLLRVESRSSREDAMVVCSESERDAEI